MNDYHQEYPYWDDRDKRDEKFFRWSISKAREKNFLKTQCSRSKRVIKKFFASRPEGDPSKNFLSSSAGRFIKTLAMSPASAKKIAPVQIILTRDSSPISPK
jgi:hypothetical protein